MSEADVATTVRGHLETIREEAASMPQEGGPEATIIEQCDSALDFMKKSPTGKLQELVDVAKSPGNADHTEYLRGMANGLILALHVIEGRDGEVPYVDPPPDGYGDPEEETDEPPHLG